MSARESAGATRGVLHFTYSLDFGGVEKHLEIIARTGGRHWRHAFCALTTGGAAERAIAATGAPVRLLGCPPPHLNPRTIRRVAAFFREERPDVIHCHGFEGNLVGIIAAWLAGIPVRIAEEIGIAQRRTRTRLAINAAYRLSHKVIGVSDYVRDWLVGEGLPAGKAVRIYNPVILPTASARARQGAEPLRIGFVGRLDPVKNPLALVTAVSKLIREGLDLELLIIGDGSFRGALEQAAAADEQGRIKILGFVEEPSPLLGTCHVYVQPSISEGFGIALVEAMACGLPALVTRDGGMIEIVDEGTTGWFLREPAAAQIERALREIYHIEPAELFEMGVKARDSVTDRFDAEAYIREIESLYDRLSPATADARRPVGSAAL